MLLQATALRRVVVSGLAAFFADEAGIFDGDGAFHAFAEVVDCERGDGGGGERFHFHACFGGGAAG